MAAIPNIINMIAGINQRKRAGAEREALSNYLQDPEGATQALLPVNPDKAIALDQMQTQQELAAQKAKADRIAGGFKYLRGMPEGTDYGMAIDGMGGFLKGMGFGEDDVGSMRSLVSQPGFNPAMLDDDAWEAYVKDQYDTTVMTPGSHALRGGKVVHEVPYQMKTVTTRGGDGASRTDVFDPNSGSFVADGGMAPEQPAGLGPVGQWSVDQLFPHFVQQESADNYTAVNKETGAMGRYQIMPDTGRALAKRAGVAWRPDRMTKDDEASRKYQDALGRAAIQEAVDYGMARGGNLDEITGYYYAGPNRDGWGPRTAQYQSDMRGRLGVGGEKTPTSVSMPGKAPKPEKTFRAATKQEIAAAGYPTGTAAQIGSDGKMVNIKTPPRPKTGAAAKTKTPEEEKAGRGGVTNVLTNMVDQYVQLDELNAIVDDQDSFLSNIGNRIAGSSIGQMAGQAVGTEAQGIRDSINNSRPLLMNQIREATGMSARSMDSNKELEFYLQAVSDPGSGNIVSNLAALAVLDNLYGDGTALDGLPADLKKRVQQRSLILRRTTPVESLPQPRAKAGGVAVGTVIRNPKTGERKRWDGNAWEDM